jgi:DNA invertase Pin-like site-specific DNA recombinase
MTLPIDIYARVSREGNREHITAYDDQEREARSFAAAHGLTIGQVLVDRDASGGTLDRPKLQEALARVRAGDSGGIVVAYLSRASRDTRQGLELLETIRLAGGEVFAPNLPDYTTADGRMLTTMQLAIDTGYRERKAEELERAKASAIADGIPINTRAAVGLRKVRVWCAPRGCEVWNLAQDPATAPVVREVFELRAQGEGPALLGRHLEAAGVPTSQGSKTWSKEAAYGLIANPIYYGKLRYGSDDRYVFTLEDPIVDFATWTAAQHPNGRRLSPPRSKSSEFILTGTLRCWACRYCLQATTTSRGKRIYRCTRTHSGGVCPAPARVDAERVERIAVEAFWAVTGDIEAVGAQDTHDAVSGLQEALARAQRRLDEIETQDAQDAFRDRWLAVVKQRRDERDRAAEELGKARAEVRTSLPQLPVETLRGNWPRMTAQDRRELIGLTFDCIALRRDPLAVVYPAGVGPDDLPRRGFTRVPVLRPFADGLPDGARVLAL